MRGTVVVAGVRCSKMRHSACVCSTTCHRAVAAFAAVRADAIADVDSATCHFARRIGLGSACSNGWAGRPVAAALWTLFGAAAMEAACLSYFCAHRTRNLLQNITTNERINCRRGVHIPFTDHARHSMRVLVGARVSQRRGLARRRYAHFRSSDGGFVNPFDRGVRANVRAYFCVGSARAKGGGRAKVVAAGAGLLAAAAEGP